METVCSVVFNLLREQHLWSWDCVKLDNNIDMERTSSWIRFGIRRTKKHMGTPERANFDFRSIESEDLGLRSRCSSSRSSHSSSSSIGHGNTEYITNPGEKAALHLGKIFLYVLPFVIILLCFIWITCKAYLLQNAHVQYTKWFIVTVC